ncbi:transglutaminase domain-containing protein [Thermococcus piezophilus]|uniref:Transglutaminase-like domain-containing protein n=1 Tax=Thermococcus piezophilus TaxID=1712654 RepID=A0A172WGQ2_9EURY|nr:transglutaminase domain-containing protein [Thermococcus piezophilus]ANF22611.1 hypothetical protein A7C91_05080 [Thermococcus piezophilus]
MARRKYVTFFILILLSILIISSVLGPVLIKAPPQTKSLERFLLQWEPTRNETNETGPPIEVPENGQFMLLVTGASHVSYLRANVYTDYINGSWLTKNTSVLLANTVAPPMPEVPHHAERDTIGVISFAPLSGNLYTSLYTTMVNASGVEALPEYNLFKTAVNVSTYSFSAVSYTFQPYFLHNLSAGNLTDYLSAPNDTRLVSLARAITRNATDDYEKAQLIAEFLRKHYTYLENPERPNGTDPLTWFLFESKEGTSKDFASAFVILARLNGIPARLVEGFYIRAVPGTQIISNKDRWFWAELYFDKAGWLTFDPLRKDPNLFRPFELEVSPNSLELQPGGEIKLNITLMNVVNNSKVYLYAYVPEKPALVFLLNPGTSEITLRTLQSPGSYGIVLKAMVEHHGKVMKEDAIVIVNVSGGVKLRAEPAYLVIKRGSLGTVRIYTEDNVTELILLPMDSSFLPVLLPDRKGAFNLLFYAPSEPEWHFLGIRTAGENPSFLYIPVKVIDWAKVTLFDWPQNATAGDTITISGTVADSTGVVLDEGTIYTTLDYGNRSILLGFENLTGKLLQVNFTLPRYLAPGVYNITFHYFPSWGAPYVPRETWIEIAVKALAEFDVPEQVVSLEGNVTVKGHLVGGDGKAIANASIEYSLDKNYMGTVNTSENGEFSLRVLLTQLGSHNLSLYYPGDASYSPAEVNVEIAIVEMELPEKVEAELGKPVKITGGIIGLEKGQISARIYPGKLYKVPVSNGSFTLTLEPFNFIGERSIDFYHGDNLLARTTVVIVSPIKIELLTNRSEGEETTVIKFKALDALNDPVPNVFLTVEMENEIRQVMTNASGIATLEVPVPDDEKNVTVRVFFRGSSYYLPAEETFHVLIVKKREIPWLYLGIALLLAVVIARYGLVRKKAPKVEREPVLKIIFNNGIPLFKEGEVIEISVECENEPELYVDGKPVGKGKDFRLKLPLGEHTIEARCGGLVERATARIVKSYNDAVVEHYDRCFLPWGKETGVNVDELTPREIEAVLTDMMYPWEPLDVLTEIFEKAKYSHREVSREEFIRFYRALLTLIGGGCVV